MGDRNNRTGKLAFQANQLTQLSLGQSNLEQLFAQNTQRQRRSQELLASEDLASLFFGTAASVKQTKQQLLGLQQSFLTQELATKRRLEIEQQDLNAVLASQTASAAARGFTAASPSFQAIQKRSLDAFAADEFAETFNLSQQEQAFQAQKEDIVNRQRFRSIASIFNIGRTAVKSFSGNAGSLFGS